MKGSARFLSAAGLALAVAASCSWEHVDTPTHPPPPLVYVVDGTLTEYPSGVPVDAATITFQQKTTVTDSAGAFELRGLVPGADNLTAAKPGYITQKQILTIRAEQTEYRVSMQIARMPAGR